MVGVSFKGDMKKSVYDSDGNGKTDVSETAESVDFCRASASESLRKAVDAQNEIESIDWILVPGKEFLVPPKYMLEGVFRVKFAMRSTSASIYAFGQIRKNGAIVGILRQCYSTFNTFVEDLSFKADDLIQLYGRQDPPASGYYKDFRVYNDDVNIDFNW